MQQLPKLVMDYRYFFLLLMLFSKIGQSAQVYSESSLNTTNRTPLVSLFQLAQANYDKHFAGAATSDSGLQVSMESELINYFDSTAKGSQIFTIDGETRVSRLKLDYRFSPVWSAGANLQWINHSQGQLDSFIYHWHDVFGLPQNGRTRANKDRFRIRLSQNGNQIVDINRARSSWGDSTLTLSYQPKRWQFTGFIKLPTGQFDQLSGSESFDFGIAAAAANPDWFRSRQWLQNTNLALWYGTGFSYLGIAKDLKPMNQNRGVITGRIGLGWQPVQSPWSLQLQLDSHSALFESDIKALGSFPIQLTMATRYGLGSKGSISFRLVEDARPGASPDVSIALGLNWQMY